MAVNFLWWLSPRQYDCIKIHVPKVHLSRAQTQTGSQHLELKCKISHWSLADNWFQQVCISISVSNTTAINCLYTVCQNVSVCISACMYISMYHFQMRCQRQILCVCWWDHIHNTNLWVHWLSVSSWLHLQATQCHLWTRRQATGRYANLQCPVLSSQPRHQLPSGTHLERCSKSPTQ